MKRKFKLITTIASLTAAIALLMFGVYAAGVRNVGVTGTVGFTAVRVNATVKVEQAYNLEDLEDLVEIGEAQVFDASLEQNQNGSDVLLGDEGNISLDDETNLSYTYKITVTNTFTADNDIKVTFAWGVSTDEEEPSAPEHDGMTIVLSEEKVQTIAPTESASYTVVVTVTDPAQIPTSLALVVSSHVTMEVA